MATGTLSTLDASFVRGGAGQSHAHTAAGRQAFPGAALLSALEATILLLGVAVVLIATNRNAMPHGLDNFLSMRVTLKNLLLLLLLVCTWRVLFEMCGLYSVRGIREPRVERQRVCAASAAASALAFVIMFPTTNSLPPASFAYLFVVTSAGTLTLRAGRRALSRLRIPLRVLIVGTGARAHALWMQLAADASIEYEVAGFLDTADGRPASPEIAQLCLGTLEDLEPLLMGLAIDEVCVTLPVKSHYRDIQETIRVCERVGVRTKYQANLFESQVAWARYDDPSSPTVTMHVVPSDYRLLVKRGMDVTGAAAAIVVLSPVMLAIALAVSLTSPGPVIFAQERYGLNRRRFRMFKFRTMRVDAEEMQAALETQNEADGPVFKIADDPRVTPIGRFLRRTSLDELPQFVNVLRGEMSLVGPRPLPLRDVARFSNASDMRRFSVRPGVTCLWQVSGRSTLSFSDWIRLDLKYIDGWSLGLDLLILVRTVPAVLFGKGAQ